MNLQTQIRQQQSTVQMLEKLFRAKRCSQSELDQAKSRLADLEQQVNFKPLVPAPADPQEVAPDPVVTGRLIEGDEYLSLQADLSRQADGLNRKMADLSNKLHLVPPTANCPELTKPILELKAQIEAVWDKKRYLERNHVLPEESPAEATNEPDLPTLEGKDKFELAYEKRRLIDKCSKLRKKLTNLQAKPGNVNEWQTELAQAELAIQAIEVQLI